MSRRTRWFRIEASTDTPSLLIVREGFDAAWRAEVDGVEVPVYRADGRHMAIPIDAGDSVVVLRHRPLMLLPGLVISVASTLAAAALILAPRGRRSGGAGHLVDGPIPDPAGGTTRSG